MRDDFLRTALPVTGAAPWALSALPECFRQLASATGPAAFARAKLPRSAERLPDGAALRVADCSVIVAPTGALVTRGENRLILPAGAALYLARGRLALERPLSAGREDVRLYALRGALHLTLPHARAKPRFAARHSDE